MKPDLTESLMSAFTVEGQCEHILVHTERPLLSSPNTFAGRRAGEEAWEEIMWMKKGARPGIHVFGATHFSAVEEVSYS